MAKKEKKEPWEIGGDINPETEVYASGTIYYNHKFIYNFNQDLLINKGSPPYPLEEEQAFMKKVKNGMAGQDVKSDEKITIEPGECKTIHTQEGFNLSHNSSLENNFITEVSIFTRTELASNHGIEVINSPITINPGFQGYIDIILVNLGKEPYTIQKGQPIAQFYLGDIEIKNPNVKKYRKRKRL